MRLSWQDHAFEQPASHRVIRGGLRERYARVRNTTRALCEGLSPDDCQVQSMPDASPVKWHLAHTSWFFETFVLATHSAAYVPFNSAFAGLFNSYYQSLGTPYPRAQRGLLTRPSFEDVLAYRVYVDTLMAELFGAGALSADLRARVELGIQHEQQHQELILTDLKHALSINPLRPAYRIATPVSEKAPASGEMSWLEHGPGIIEIGHASAGFAFDNERPRHRVWLESHALASRTVSNREYLEFMQDGGYSTPTLWLADGWSAVQTHGWSRPLYWNEDASAQYTLHGMQPLDPDEPVCHLSYYEADAYARWAGARLPLEAEWELAASRWPVEGNFLDGARLHPRRAGEPEFFGNVWEWTASPYVAYPRFRSGPGALGEYNGKFMCNQLVLRGGSCVSPASHLRASYRNFFPADARWQFSGVRLARDAA